MKKQRIINIVMLVLVAVLLAVLIALLIAEYVTTGTLAKNSVIRAALIGLSLAAIAYKWLTVLNAKRKNADFPYRENYADVIGNAFSDDKRLEKRLFAALAAFRSRNFARAIKMLNQLFPEAKTPDERFSILFFSARAYFLSGYLDVAARIYEKCFEIKKSAAAASNLGLCYDGLGEDQKAEKWYNTAIELEPDNAYANNNMGHLYMMRCEYGKALEYCLRAIELKSNLEDALCNAAICYGMVGNREEYERYLRLAVVNGASRRDIEDYLISLNAPVTPGEE